jgi:hypothetical protein
MQKLIAARALFLVTLLLTICCVAFGQETTGSIEGTVKDPAGALVPNINITITNAKTAASGTTTTGIGAGFKRTSVSNDEGFFRVLQVPPGTYDVVTTPASGFGEARYENVTVTIGQSTQLTITVNPGSNVTRVDIVASETVPVDVSNNAIQTTINAQKIELLPKSTGFTGLLKAVPGTRPESRSGGFSVDGASGGENVFVIDGQEVTNYRTGTLNETYNIPTQLVQEVQVKSSGFEATYGGATGGVVSVVTRGGGNDLHGEFGMQWELAKLNGEARPILNRFTTTPPAAFVQTAEYFNPGKVGGTNYFPTANLGGKIIKDRLWFFGSYTPQIFESIADTLYLTNAPAPHTLTSGERYHRTRRYEYAFGRIDANPFSKLRLTGTFLWNPVIDNGSIPTNSYTNVSTSTITFGNVPTANFGPGIGVLSGHNYTDRQGGRQSSNLATIAGVYTATNKLIIDGRYSRGFLNEKLGNYFVPEVVQIFSCNTTATHPIFPCSTTAANTITRKDVSLRQSYDFSAAYIFSAGGQHELRGGYQRFTIFNDVQSGNSTVGRLSFNFGTSITTLIGGNVTATPGAIGSGSFRRTGTNGHGSNLSQGLFIQDKYQPFNRLTLNLGVRIEKENLPSFNSFPSAINFGWGDKIAPRLGFAYDVTGKGRTKIFASYGKFFDRVKFELPRGLFGGDIFLEDYFEIFPGDTATGFNIANILNGFTGPSVCPSSGFITAGARSRCQKNLRVNANDPNASALNGGAVDPNLKPFQQTEFTVGGERQLSRDYVLRLRYTYKNVDEAVEDAGIVNAAGSEAYIIGNPGSGLHLATLQALGYNKSTRPQRRYDGFEVVLEKRLTNNWYFNANYTLSRLYGNYSGLASSDEPHLVNGRLSPGVSRAFDLPFIGFTARGEKDNGRLQTDRPHVFNIFGSYILDWKKGSRGNSTEFSAFQTITSGTPQTTTIYGASTVTPQIFLGRGDLGRSPTYSQTDLNVTHRYRFGQDNKWTMALDLNFLNLFDQATVTGVYTTMNPSSAPVNAAALGGLSQAAYANGYTDGSLLNAILARIASLPERSDIRYKQPFLYQQPRTVRFGVRFLF